MGKLKYKVLILMSLIGLMLNSCRTGCGCPMAKGKAEKIWTSTGMVLAQKK